MPCRLLHNLLRHRPTRTSRQPRLRPRVAGAWFIGLLLLLLVVRSPRSGLLLTVRKSTSRSFDAQVRAHKVKSIDVYGSVAYGEFVEPPLLKPSAEEAKDSIQGRQRRQRANSRGGRARNFGSRFRGKMLIRSLFANGARPALNRSRFTSRRITATCCCSIWLGLLIFLVIGGWGMARRARDQMMGGGMMSGVLRSPARRYSTEGPAGDV